MRVTNSSAVDDARSAIASTVNAGRTAPVEIRAMRPADHALFAPFADSLSSATRYQRFFSLRTLPDAEVRGFYAADDEGRCALIAVVREAGEEREVGVARFVVDGDSSSADFAVLVADRWQGQGVGRRLLVTLIAKAHRAGVSVLRGAVLSTNYPMLSMARSLGFALLRDPADATVTWVERGLTTG